MKIEVKYQTRKIFIFSIYDCRKLSIKSNCHLFVDPFHLRWWKCTCSYLIFERLKVYLLSILVFCHTSNSYVRKCEVRHQKYEISFLKSVNIYICWQLKNGNRVYHKTRHSMGKVIIHISHASINYSVQ